LRLEIPAAKPAPWQNAQYYFYKWTADGTWERVNAALRRRVRVVSGRNPDPTAGSVDAQSGE
jgi:putative transposase